MTRRPVGIALMSHLSRNTPSEDRACAGARRCASAPTQLIDPRRPDGKERDRSGVHYRKLVRSETERSAHHRRDCAERTRRWNMAFRLDYRRPPAKELVRIVAKEFERTLGQVAADNAHRAEGIHEARKSIKKIIRRRVSGYASIRAGMTRGYRRA